MKKIIIMFIVGLMSTSTFANECASNISELKLLVGNSDLSLNWLEKSKDPLTLTLKNEGKLLGLNLKKNGLPWADVTGVICRKGENYVANVTTLKWGEAAPGLAKKANIQSINMKLPYQSVLKVKILLFSFEFHAK